MNRNIAIVLIGLLLGISSASAIGGCGAGDGSCPNSQIENPDSDEGQEDGAALQHYGH